jgi:imidazolonepropionase-like amidohydrolase
MEDHAPILKPSRFSLLAALGLTLGALLLWRSLPVPGEAPRGNRTLLRQVFACAPGTPQDQASLLDLLWQDGRIIAVGHPSSLESQGAFVIEGRGRTVAPALCDAAVFLSLEGRHPDDSVPAGPRPSLERQAAAGVSLLLDLNAHRAFIHEARSLQGPLPRTFFAGALFTSSGGWRLKGQTPWNSHVVELIEPEDLDAPWGRAVRFGDQAAFVSVEHEGRDGLAVPLPALRRLGALARSRGLPFIIHAHHSAKALEALQAQPDALLGPLFDAGDGRLAEALRRQGAHYIPALSTLLNAFPPEQGVSVRAWLSSFPAAATLERAVLSAATEPGRVKAWARHWTRQGADPAQALGVPAALHAQGVKLAFGSGSGQPLVFHGLGAATELAHLQRAGLSTPQILEMSRHSRELLGQRGGRLRRGDPADLLLLDADPWADPARLTDPRKIYLSGVSMRP